MSDDCVLTARWVFPATGPPLANGTVTIRGNTIVAVDAAGARTPDTNFGNAALLPGLVNAHTHLDLTGLRGLVPPSTDFVGWLRQVIAQRRSTAPEQTARDIHTGLAEALRFGTTLLGDIAAGGSSYTALTAVPVWSVCFRELLGLPSARVMSAWTELVRWMQAHPDTATCRVGVSPHAPYSVHKALIEATARLWPVAIHLAESPAERELLDHRTGDFVSFLRALDVWDPHGLAPSVEWVLWKSSRAPQALFVHSNYLPATALLPAHATVVYCPRTHAAFGHARYPLRELLDRGVRVALGTDSLASNPDLDVLAEGRYVRQAHPDVAGADVLRMLTIYGAEALGFAARTGSLAAGKSADLVVEPLPDRDSADPHELLLAPATPASRATMWRGVWRQPA